MPKLGRDMIKKYNLVVCLDSTHATTLYDILVAQHEFGRGLPVAFLISSDGYADNIKTFLAAFKQICPAVNTFITDNDNAEIDAITTVFPESNHLLCWWHVLKNWKQKLQSSEYQSNEIS